MHDNFYWMSHFGDPSFSHHRATASVWIIAALMLTTTPLPPLDMSFYTWVITREATEIDTEYRDILKAHGVSLGKVHGRCDV